MQQLISGQLRPPQSHRQKLLHKNAGELLLSLSHRKDAAEVLDDRLQSVPQGLLPIVF